MPNVKSRQKIQKESFDMLVTMKEMLADAKKNHYAIPAFDVSN